MMSWMLKQFIIKEEDQLKKILVKRMIIKGKCTNTYRRTESIILILLMWYIIV